MAGRLSIQAPGSAPRQVPLEGSRVAIGRAHDNDLRYPDDPSLSRHHLVFEGAGAEWTVRDLDSKNGTHVNGVRIESPCTLSAGDRIVAGRLVMVFGDDRDRGEDARVTFYVGSEDDTPPAATVMTSLEGVLSGESGGQAGARPAADAGLRSPMVHALIRAGKELAGDLPLDELFRLILELSIDTVDAERGLVLTVEGDELVTRACNGEGFRISTAVRDRVLKQKASVLVRDVLQEEALRDRLSLVGQHIRAMMAVPLQTDHGVIGLVYVDSRFDVRDFTPDDLNLLTVLANIAAVRIEHQRLAEVEKEERRMVLELNQAASIQQGILPASAPEVAGLDLAGHNVACHTVGGDYYDFLPYPDGRIGLVLGDVAGKGMPAALMMCSLQARVQVLFATPGDVAELVGRLDRSVSANCPSNRFITLFFGLFDPASGELMYCNAGHNPPLLIRGDGRRETLTGGGTVLGILPEIGYEKRSCRLEPGDVLAVFSDGVTEALSADDEEYGEERLAGLLEEHRTATAEQLIHRINADVAEFTAGAPPADDVTLVVARRTAIPGAAPEGPGAATDPLTGDPGAGPPDRSR